MLVKICDICGERINVDNYVKLEGGTIRDIEKNYCDRESEFYECDICMSCARSLNLTQIIEKIVL